MNDKYKASISRMNSDLSNEFNYKKKENISLFDLIQEEQYVGEVIGIDYEKVRIQVSDAYKQKVGGIPSQCFLIATRIKPGLKEDDFSDLDKFYNQEDVSVVLLRVNGTTALPGDMDKERILVENVERAQGREWLWDERLQDPMTKNLMSFGALQCHIMGTFYMEKESDKFKLLFGSDLTNFYPNRGLKVYKPSKKALEMIINYGVEDTSYVKIGNVRYCSTNRMGRGISDVNVKINPLDLVSEKTAVFGMTRTGKSNTVKIIAKSIYQLRQGNKKKRIGQIIFDANGEYANDNTQDKNNNGDIQSLKNVWQIPVNGEMGSPKDVVTYGLLKNKKDPNRILMKINFYDDDLLQTGKELIDNQLRFELHNKTLYITGFLNVFFENMEDLSYGEKIRERRRRLIYKTFLNRAGFKDQTDGRVYKEERLFSNDLIDALYIGIKDFDNLSENKQKEYEKNLYRYREAAEILRAFNESGGTYAQLAIAFEIIASYISDVNSTYENFEREYITHSDNGSHWLDLNTSSLLEMFKNKNAGKRIEKAKMYHDPKSSKRDYAEMIYDDLCNGKLVIIDQALGEADLNQLAAERILRKIFDGNNLLFSEGEEPADIIIYVEEAHNLMPKGSEEDTKNIWARVAKEGAKFHIGMVYSTQEVSSIQTNILKNTTNWFVSHLNNRQEIKTLSDFYDFSDFASSILQSDDKGFIRMKTRSNRFVIPIQVDRFQIDL